MCIIIDNDVAARVLVQKDPEFAPVWERLFRNNKPPIRLAYGGKLRDELFGNGEVAALSESSMTLGERDSCPTRR